MAYTEQDRRNHIRELQQYLYSLSFLDETLPRVIPDGIYGRQTALAVRAFQQKNGLRPNGETNRATWDAIVNAYRQQIQREATPLHLYTPERELLGAGETGLLVLVLQSILKTLGGFAIQIFRIYRLQAFMMLRHRKRFRIFRV
jgi:hypothetical protein